MASVEAIKASLIEKILAISDKDYLSALNKLIAAPSKTNEEIVLSEEQITLLRMSEEDIVYNRLTPQEDLDKNDLEWLKGL